MRNFSFTRKSEEIMVKLPFLVGVILAVVAHSKASHTRSQERILHQVYDDCSNDLDIPLGRHYFERGFLGGLTDKDPKAVPFIYCVMERMEFVNCAGKIGKQALVDFFTDGHDVQSLPGVVDECDEKKKGATVAERSFSFYRCFFEQKKFVI
ncbi:uncharacterized protein LOC120428337 [Culex pipiens pallens]|uniref:uncharacterized protein LOC120428337 n=1 Tax=Culex pipiens pallens TaxID=42434 RepID=UPI001952DA34|nr:uncharacterized protein LOC120428337 [Culex pipiens pallens]